MLHMLDTDTASYLIRGRAPIAAARLAELPPNLVCISAITRAELLYGLKRVPPEHRLHLAERSFLKVVQVFPWDADAADYYADIRHQLEASNPLADRCLQTRSVQLQGDLGSKNRQLRRSAESPH